MSDKGAQKVTKKDRYPYPTRAQWAALVHIRDQQKAGRRAFAGGRKVTMAALERLEWASWVKDHGWKLLPNGVVAVNSGDKRFLRGLR